MDRGRVILLNGAPSAGKTTVARAVQTVMDEPWLIAGIDTFRAMLPPRWIEDGARAHEGFEWSKASRPGDEPALRITAGPVGERVVSAMHRAVRAIVDTGLDVIVDDVVLEHAWLRDWAVTLDGVDAWLVGVRCPAAVLRERERLRATRPIGEAVGQLATVHTDGDYDLEIDTSLATPERCAGRIADHLARHRPRALTRLRATKP